MARVRAVEISNFRGIKSLSWFPSAGINCLTGPGDSGKSTVLDAIDFCLGARRSIEFTDADFYRLDAQNPITISVTIGDLDDGLRNLDTYGLYLRGFDPKSKQIEDEPEKDAETVLTVRLTVASDLEPAWSLVSERAEAQGQTRNLGWGDRVRLAPTRIGSMASYHLAWRHGSVLNRVSEERANNSAALARVAREARAAFGDQADGELAETLRIVGTTAKDLGIPVGEAVKAMLDARSLFFGDGRIALHDDNGIPLYGLGTGSTRLLIAGLQRKAAAKSTIMLIDELEHGLEPHRIIRLLGSLGAKETSPPIQVFMTTHSPIALRELSGQQLFILRRAGDKHIVLEVGSGDETQSTIRLYPDAFLAPSIIVCEGASEVGLVRGLDLHRTASGLQSLNANGVALIDCGGGDPDKPFKRAAAFRGLGYRVAIIRDDDKKPDQTVEMSFIAAGGQVFRWRDGNALEDELFMYLTDEGVGRLIDRAIELHGPEVVNEHIKSAAQNAKNLAVIQADVKTGNIPPESRKILGKASRTRKAGWFKSVSWMEEVARDIIGPDLAGADADFRTLVESIFEWTGNSHE